MDGYNGHRLFYAPYAQPFDLQFVDVTERVKYLGLLNAITIDYKGIDEGQLNRALFEALWLYDTLFVLDQNQFIKKKWRFSAENTCELFITSCFNEYEKSVLNFFNNIPLEYEIYYSQVKYFVLHYVKNKFNLSFLMIEETNANSFDTLLRKYMRDYLKNALLDDDQKDDTLINKEYDLFIMQLNVKIDQITVNS